MCRVLQSEKALFKDCDEVFLGAYTSQNLCFTKKKKLTGAIPELHQTGHFTVLLHGQIILLVLSTFFPKI